jgi:hypothetical protein
MRLSLSWVFVVILTGFIAYFGRYGWKVYEEFTMNDFVEGFLASSASDEDILITTCPYSEINPNQRMKAIVPKGSTETFCYDGTLKRCSLSADPKNSESCTQYYLDYFNQKSIQCPLSMPKYFNKVKNEDNVDTSIRGCTSGKRTADGTAPVSVNDPVCYFYNNLKDEIEKLDSCTNIKMLESSDCFSSVEGKLTAELVPPQGGQGSPWIKCTLVHSSTSTTGRAIQQNILPTDTRCK